MIGIFLLLIFVVIIFILCVIIGFFPALILIVVGSGVFALVYFLLNRIWGGRM